MFASPKALVEDYNAHIVTRGEVVSYLIEVAAHVPANELVDELSIELLNSLYEACLRFDPFDEVISIHGITVVLNQLTGTR